MRTLSLCSLIVLLLATIPGQTNAQVIVTREGTENPAIVVARSILWGGFGGLILGGATALAVDDHQEEIIKWSFVGGTFGGLVLGMWHVTHRPEPRGALLDFSPDGLSVDAPDSFVSVRMDPWNSGTVLEKVVFVPLVSFHR